MQEPQALTSPRGDSPLVSKTGEIPAPIVHPPSDAFLAAGQQVNLDRMGPTQITEARAMMAFALRVEGFSYKEIAEQIGLTVRQVEYALSQVRRKGKLQDVIDLIDNDAVPRAVENILEALRSEKRDGVDGERWWEATKKILEGRGVFRRFSNNRVDGGGVGNQLPPLQINILSPSGGELPTVIVNSEKGSVIGSARGE